MHTDITCASMNRRACVCTSCVSLYKILFHFKAVLWESMILSLLPSHLPYPITILLHHHCAIYAPPPTILFMIYTIQYW